MGTATVRPLILRPIVGPVPKVKYDVDEAPGVEPLVLDSPCGVMFSDGSELSPLAYRERLAKDGEDGYGSCVNLNKVKRRAIK